MQMLDFTSALYLGMQHPSWTLPAWRALTLGKPALLEDPPGADELEGKLAALTGCDAALLASSTLHAFFDLFAILAGPGTAVFIDRSSYPISWWAAQHMAGRGNEVTFFAPRDVCALHAALRRNPGVRPIIVTDGITPMNGVPAPLAAYANVAETYGGIVVVDDTQALGILGNSASARCPYGFGGGGSLKYAGIHSEGMAVVSSLAKAFGVPVAMMGGSRALVARLRGGSLMRKHCSPPSAAVISAATQALHQNRSHGDALRAKLTRNVARLRCGLNRVGTAASETLFPVQALRLPGATASSVHTRLFRHGVRTVLQRDPRSGVQVSFLLTARHSFEDIDGALVSLADATRPHTRTTGVSSYDSKS